MTPKLAQKLTALNYFDPSIDFASLCRAHCRIGDDHRGALPGRTEVYQTPPTQAAHHLMSRVFPISSQMWDDSLLLDA